MRFRTLLVGFVAASLPRVAVAAPSSAPPPPAPAVLFENVRIFDGTSGRLSEPPNVPVMGNPITNLDLIGDPAKNFVVITKDGKVFKKSLQ